MKITYDKRADAILIRFKEGRVSRDAELSGNVFAGYSREGELLEIQILEVKAIEPAWISLEAAATILGKSTRTLLRWIDAGKVSPAKVGRDYRFTAEMVQALMGESDEQPQPVKAGERRR
jgi:excisionase family DNA binding protein